MKSKITEIKNRTALIQDLLTELTEVINEVELAETINTKKAHQKRFEEGVFLAGSTVNELEDYEVKECKTNCIPKAAAIAGFLLLVVYILSNL